MGDVMIPMPLDSTLGVYFTGFVIATGLWGVTCSQIWHYYMTRPKDPRFLQVLVAVTWVADTAHQIAVVIAVYRYCVQDFGDPFKLLVAPPTSPLQIALLQVVMTVVQFTYAYRIWNLTKYRLWLMIPIGVLGLAEFVASIFDVYTNAKYKMWLDLLSHQRVIGGIYAAIAATLDVILAGAMCYSLRRNRTEILYSATNSIIDRLMFFSIGTNVLTSLCATTLCALLIVSTRGFYQVAVFYVTARLYANSFMVMLNSRPFVRNGRGAVEDTIPLPTLNLRKITDHSDEARLPAKDWRPVGDSKAEVDYVISAPSES